MEFISVFFDFLITYFSRKELCSSYNVLYDIYHLFKCFGILNNWKYFLPVGSIIRFVITHFYLQ